MLNRFHTYSHFFKHSITWLVLICIFQSSVLLHLEYLLKEVIVACKIVDTNDSKTEKESSIKDIGEQDHKLQIERLNAIIVNLTLVSLQTHSFLEFTTIHYSDIITPPPEA